MGFMQPQAEPQNYMPQEQFHQDQYQEQFYQQTPANFTPRTQYAQASTYTAAPTNYAMPTASAYAMPTAQFQDPNSALFDQIDANHNGTISREEFSQFLTQNRLS